MRVLVWFAALLAGCFVPDYSANSRLRSCLETADCQPGSVCVRGGCLPDSLPEAGNDSGSRLDANLSVDAGGVADAHTHQDTGSPTDTFSPADAGSTQLIPTDLRLLSSSCWNSCLIKNSQVFCMGSGEFGANGDGTNEDRDVPTQVENLTNAVEVVSFDSGACARLENGTVWCWGLNSVGQLGNNLQVNSNTPVQVASLSGVVSISGGRDHVCALNRSAEVWCWGGNAEGQIGDNNGNNIRLFPVQILSGVSQIDLGNYSTCTLKSDDTIWCWGQNTHGMIDTVSQAVHEPTQIDTLGHTFVEVRTGTHSACARKEGGSVWCWGHNDYGEFGNNSYEDSLVPVEVPEVSDAIGLAVAGFYKVCVLRSDHTMWCSGINRRGSQGNGSLSLESVHRQVLDITNVVAMARDGVCEANMARTADGQTYVWGENVAGKLGLGANAQEYYSVPQRLSGF